VFEKRVLRKIFWSKWDEVTGECIMRSLMICTPIQYCMGGQIEKNDMGGTCIAYGGGVWCSRGWWRNVREREHLGNPGIDERTILRWIFNKWNVVSWIESNWLRIAISGGHL
jgi:hypothetical protein